MSRVNCNKCTVAQVIVVIAAVSKVFKSKLTVGQVVQYRTSIALAPTIEEHGYLLYTHPHVVTQHTHCYQWRFCGC